MSTDFLPSLLMCFIALFVAVDVLGILPIYTGLVEGTSLERRRNLVRDCLLSALLLGMLFLFLGRAVFRLIGITMGDFQVAGGLVLLLIGVLDLVGDEKKLRKPAEALGVVPLGIPLIVGPAVISVLLLLHDQYGSAPTLVAFVANLVIVGLGFRFAPALRRVMGANGMRATSKVMMLLLIAIGVRMIRLGIVSFIGGATAAG